MSTPSLHSSMINLYFCLGSSLVCCMMTTCHLAFALNFLYGFLGVPRSLMTGMSADFDHPIGQTTLIEGTYSLVQHLCGGLINSNASWVSELEWVALKPLHHPTLPFCATDMHDLKSLPHLSFLVLMLVVLSMIAIFANVMFSVAGCMGNHLQDQRVTKIFFFLLSRCTLFALLILSGLIVRHPKWLQLGQDANPPHPVTILFYLCLAFSAAICWCETFFVTVLLLCD